MLDYETCRKLKEAGFPQGSPLSRHAHILNDGGFCENERCDFLLRTQYVKTPSLSELIEACGKDIILHGPDTSDVGEGCWRSPTKHWSVYKDFFTNLHGIGSSPEEAVANLYLELKKNR